MKCWTIRYYFRRGRKKRKLQGVLCGCIGGETKAEAIATVSPIEMDEGCTLIKITATPSKKEHYCFTNEAHQ